ncbi:MAG: MBL fold metallo-hydrolase [Gemmatimonadaceae bacterium]
MRLTTVGTGTAAPSPSRVNAGHLVEAGEVRLLLDCGSGVVHRMASLGLPWSDLTHVALTHFHADHVSDLATLFVAWRYGQLPPRSAPVTLLGPPGTAALLDRLAAALWKDLPAPGYPVHVVELPPGGPAVELASGVRLSATKVPHTEESVAYCLERGGRRLVYTGDTGYDPALAAWASGCDVLLCECSLPADMAMATHLTPEECGALAAIARPRLLALTHFYPPVERIDVRAAVAARFPGPVALAIDGWSTEIEDSGCWS